jgi:hypothetical protein
MNTPITEMIFPPRLIPSLRDLRDADWAQLVDQVGALEPAHIDRLAFELLIVRWSGCFNCQADSFRAMQGCAQCAAQAVRRYRGSNTELQSIFSETTHDVEAHLNKGMSQVIPKTHE